MGACLVLAAAPAGAAAAKGPRVTRLTANHVTSHSAIITAKINTGELATSYSLVLEDPCPAPMECIRAITLASGTLPAAKGTTTVSVATAVVLDELPLEPSTVYGLEAEATNALGGAAASTTFKTKS